MIKNFFNNKKGITLIEVLVYIAVFSLSVSTLVSYFLMINVINTKNNVIANVESNSQFIFNTMERQINNSDMIVSPLSGAASPSLLLTGIEGNLKFFTDDGALFIEESIGNTYRLTNIGVLIENLEFRVSGDGRENVKISFILKTPEGGSNEFNYSRKYFNSFSKY